MKVKPVYAMDGPPAGYDGPSNRPGPPFQEVDDHPFAEKAPGVNGVGA